MAIPLTSHSSVAGILPRSGQEWQATQSRLDFGSSWSLGQAQDQAHQVGLAKVVAGIIHLHHCRAAGPIFHFSGHLRTFPAISVTPSVRQAALGAAAGQSHLESQVSIIPAFAGMAAWKFLLSLPYPAIFRHSGRVPPDSRRGRSSLRKQTGIMSGMRHRTWQEGNVTAPS